MLSIFEELFLLALDEEKGNILPLAKPTIAHTITGAILAELALQGRVCSGEKYHLMIKDEQPTGDELLDEALQAVKSSEKARKLSYWISELSEKPKKIRERLGDRLVAKNILVKDDKRYFWKHDGCVEGESLPTCKYDIKQPLRGMILAHAETDAGSLALLHIAAAGGMLPLIFTPDELSHAKRKIQEMITMTALEFPAVQTVEEIGEATGIALEDDGD